MKVRRKKIVLRSKTLPWSLTATPHPILPPIPAARHLACRLDPFPSLPFPSLPLPSPSYPSAFYLSTHPPLPTTLPSCLSNYLPTLYLPIYLSTPLQPAPLSLPSTWPAPGPVYQLPLSISFPRPFFLPLLAPSPPKSKPRFFPFFPFLC